MRGGDEGIDGRKSGGERKRKEKEWVCRGGRKGLGGRNSEKGEEPEYGVDIRGGAGECDGHGAGGAQKGERSVGR